MLGAQSATVETDLRVHPHRFPQTWTTAFCIWKNLHMGHFNLAYRDCIATKKAVLIQLQVTQEDIGGRHHWGVCARRWATKGASLGGWGPQADSQPAPVPRFGRGAAPQTRRRVGAGVCCWLHVPESWPRALRTAQRASPGGWRVHWETAGGSLSIKLGIQLRVWLHPLFCHYQDSKMYFPAEIHGTVLPESSAHGFFYPNSNLCRLAGEALPTFSPLQCPSQIFSATDKNSAQGPFA